MNVKNCPVDPEAEQGLQISAYDGTVVEVKVTESDDHIAWLALKPEEARQAAVRLLQAADLADPARGGRYGGHW